MDHYLYHRVPKDMCGTTLYPLNALKITHPNIYVEAARKYDGRESLLRDKVPFLECLWNDVIHLSPVHPAQIAEVYRELGQEFASKWYQIDAEALDMSRAIIYWYKYLDFRDKHKPGNFGPFSLDDLTGISELPQITKEYYRSMFKKQQQPLPFVGVPHVLYQGSIDISAAQIVDGVGGQ